MPAPAAEANPQPPRVVAGTQLAASGAATAQRAVTPDPVAQEMERTPLPSASPSASQSFEDYMAQSNPSDLQPESMVGEYKVTGKIGEGGMGEVYAGVHPVIGKKVAIKVLAPHVAANREVVLRFVAEARAVNQIGHRNIVDVFAFGQLNDGREYYVMEHLEGASLEDELTARPLMSPDEILTIMEQVLDPLQAAHETGIVHRDLKPDNIFLVKRGRRTEVKLLDFGIAKLSGEEAAMTRTRTGVAMGTPDYMSPEQCQGSGVDHRTDIYALGVILYRMFTGQFPHTGTSAIDLLHKQIHETPPRPSSLGPVSPHFEDIILKCLEKAPDDRYDTPAELQDALAAARETAMADGTFDPSGRHFVATTSSPDASTRQGTSPVAAARPAGPAKAAATAQVSNRALTGDPTPKSKAPMIAVIALLFAASVGGGWLAFGGGGGDEPEVAPSAPAVAAQPAVAPEPEPVAPEPEPDPEPEPAVAPAPTVGSLVIKTNLDDAEVSIDGKPRGKGRVVRVEDLAPGSYLVTIERRRYESQTLSLDITAGEETSEAVVLERQRRRGGRDRGSKDSGSKDKVEPKEKEPKKPLTDKDGTIDVFNR